MARTSRSRCYRSRYPIQHVSRSGRLERARANRSRIIASLKVADTVAVVARLLMHLQDSTTVTEGRAVSGPVLAEDNIHPVIARLVSGTGNEFVAP